MAKNLIIFSEMFPFGVHSEQAFMQHEVAALSRKFDSVIIAPSSIIGEQSSFGNFVADPSFARLHSEKNLLRRCWNLFSSRHFYREIFSKSPTFWNVAKLKKLAVFIDRMRLTERWLQKHMRENELWNEKVLIYTFWLNDKTMGALQFAKGHSKTKVISRAHGHDIFENSPFFFGYIPFQREMIAGIERLYLVSEPAMEYLSARFPQHKSKLVKRYLGVNKAEKITEASNDGILRIVSCAFVLDRKRVDLILEGIIRYTQKYKQPVFWTHFGNGPLLEQIKALAEMHRSELFDYCFKGIVPNNEILEFYHAQPVDLSLLTTAVEGGVPLALQEAQAHGIPVIATHVGGVPEIVNGKVGVLLSENPGCDEVAESIHHVYHNKEVFLTMRAESVKNWGRAFNAIQNSERFTEELNTLITQK